MHKFGNFFPAWCFLVVSSGCSKNMGNESTPSQRMANVRESLVTVYSAPLSDELPPVKIVLPLDIADATDLVDLEKTWSSILVRSTMKIVMPESIEVLGGTSKWTDHCFGVSSGRTFPLGIGYPSIEELFQASHTTGSKNEAVIHGLGIDMITHGTYNNDSRYEYHCNWTVQIEVTGKTSAGIQKFVLLDPVSKTPDIRLPF